MQAEPKANGKIGEQREYIGSAFRVAVDFIEQRGLTEQVKERVSAEAAAMIEKPPFPFAWMPARHLDELQSALSGIAGSHACFELGMAAGRNLGGSVIAPVLKMATSLFGNTPATVFQNLERFYSMVLRGMTFPYEVVSDKEGLIVARAYGSGVPAALFDVTRGNFAFVFELCGIPGIVDPPQGMRLGAMDAEARYKVHWG